ncbi:Astacin-like metalloprotease toxin, partial [Stegodyphus mimosarum]
MIKIVVVFLIAVAAASPVRKQKTRLALQNPDLFQGDILGFEPGDRNVVPYQRRRWPNKRIPYVIDRSLEKHTKLILSAMKNYEDNTCLRF